MRKRFEFKLVLSTMALLTLACCGTSLHAQDGQIPGGGGGQIPTDPGVPTNPTDPTGDRGSNVSGVGEGVGDLGNLIDLDPFNDQNFEDFRNQGFIGATAEQIRTFGFIGRPGDLIAPPLADGATFGGGVNDSVSPSVNIGGGGGGGAGFGAATLEGVVIVRRNMRSRVRPTFYTPRPSAQNVANRFSNRFALQPGFYIPQNSYTVSIQDRTAVINGTVGSQDQSDRLERQLRLEPGVYKIDNRLEILN